MGADIGSGWSSQSSPLVAARLGPLVGKLTLSLAPSTSLLGLFLFVFFGSLPTGEVEVKAEPAVVESDVSARAEADAKAATAVDAEAEADLIMAYMDGFATTILLKGDVVDKERLLQTLRRKY